MRRLAVPAVLLFTLTGCGGDAADTAEAEETTGESRQLVIAARPCGLTSSGNLADGGYSISFDTEGEEDSDGDDVEDVACMLNQLDVPDHVVSHIDGTRALDGQQMNSWGDFEARWSYHPDDGLRLTIVDKTQP